MALALAPLSRPEIRAALNEMGLRFNGNAVRPHKSARLLGTTRCQITTTDSPIRGAFLRTSIWSGSASDGYKTGYDTRPVWWVMLYIEDEAGHTMWRQGNRFANRARADREYDDSVATMRQDGEIIP